MKLMFPKLAFVVLCLSLLMSGAVSAQSKRGSQAKKAVAKKSVKHSRDAKKDRDNKKVTAKQSRKEKEKARLADAKDKKNARPGRESKKETAERRRKEAERRAAVLAELRRREQARREAIARKLAFERGLRTETVANISRDVTDGEDLAIRQAAVNALGSHAGSVVVMEAQTGKVLTIVNQDWAVRSGIKPCSTIKLVTGVAALNENVISKEDGSIKNVPTRLNLDDALAFSNNGYFQRAGVSFGNAKMIEYAKQLGLGEPTGLAIDGEYAGKLPFGNNNPRIYSHGDDFEVTGLQLAVMVSAIANGGNRVCPRAAQSSVEKASFQPFYRQHVELPQANVRRVIPGMIGAAEYGTARRGVDASQGIAGKTGSCISKGSWVGLFASVAPIEQPKYAVVVITRGQRERGKYAAAVAGQIYKALGAGIVRTDRNLAQTEFKLKPKPSIDAKTAIKLADEEDDDDATTTANGELMNTADVDRETIVVPSAQTQISVVAPAPKKLVTKTGNSKPLFPPVIITYDREGKEKRPVGTPKP